MLAAALRTRRRPTPQRLLKQQSQPLTIRHLSLGAAQFQKQRQRPPPPPQQQPKQHQHHQPKSTNLEEAKPADGTLLRKLGNNIFTHTTWTTETLLRQLSQQPRLWHEFTQLNSKVEIEPPPRQRGWPSPVLSRSEIQTYLPHLYTRGWFVEHDTPLGEDGTRGVPSLAKHFYRLAPSGGSNYESSRTTNFRAIVQGLEKQENHHVLLREDEFGRGRYDTIFLYTHNAICNKWVPEDSEASTETPSHSPSSSSASSSSPSSKEANKSPASQPQAKPQTYRFGPVPGPGITLRDVRFAFLLDDLFDLAVADARTRLGMQVRHPEWWDYSPTYSATSSSPSSSGNDSPNATETAATTESPPPELASIKRPLSTRPLSFKDLVHEALPDGVYRDQEVRAIQKAGEGVFVVQPRSR